MVRSSQQVLKRRLDGAVAAIVVTLAVATAAQGIAQASTTPSSEPFEVAGDVVAASVSAPPNIPGASGGFQIRNVDDRSQNTGPAMSNGRLTIYTTTNTRFYKCDSAGNNCETSTQAQTVVTGARVLVAGREFVSNDQYQLVANYVWSPPPAPEPPAPAPPPNPSPSGLRDFNLSNLYDVRARVVGTKVDLLGGFKLGDFTDYGCGTEPQCQVEQIVRAHNGQITVDPQPQTNVWESTDGGCNYTKQSDSYHAIAVTGTTLGVAVDGHYVHNGIDWMFFASNVYAPAPRPASQCPPTNEVRTLAATANLNEQNPENPGTFEPTTQTWQNTEWQGLMGPLGVFANGSVTMRLSWHNANGVWQFTGTYKVSANSPSQTSLAGAITGTASQPLGSRWKVSAQVTITQATGEFAGLHGDGTWTGQADSISAVSVQPPVHQDGRFDWSMSS